MGADTQTTLDAQTNDTTPLVDTTSAPDSGAADTGSEPLDVADDAVHDGQVSDDAASDSIEEVSTEGSCVDEVSDDDDELIDCDDPDCFQDPVCWPEPTPFEFPVTRRWRRTWSDEFEGPTPDMSEERQSCYEGTPQCLTLYWESKDCPYDDLEQLADLDKCTWNVFELYNWMDRGQPIGEGVNDFDPHHAEVSEGALILSAEAYPPEGGWPEEWTTETPMETIMEAYDCGNPPDEGWTYSTDCPIHSGGLHSQAMGNVAGFGQTHGRFEIRARLPVGPGSWPAHWMLPEEGPWPTDGEIDIMEAVNHLDKDVEGNFHDGVEIETDDGLIRTHMSSGVRSLNVPDQGTHFHIYAVEWTADQLDFTVDATHIGTVEEGTLRPNKDVNNGAYIGEYPLEVPDEDFYLLLNSTIAYFNEENFPHPVGFERQEHHIDYVRAYKLCEDPTDACPNGGEPDGRHCRVASIPEGAQPYVTETALYYLASEDAEDRCPHGGTFEGGKCHVMDLPSEVRAFTEDGALRYTSACIESTVSPIACPDPCAGVGWFDGFDCDLGRVPAFGTRVEGELFVHDPIGDDPRTRCPIGAVTEDRCEIASIPPGRSGFVRIGRNETNRLDHMYLEALCHPTDTMPSCALPCPEIGEYDGVGCIVGALPPNATPVIDESGLGYEPLSEDAEIRCPLGEFDGERCAVLALPEGATGFSQGQVLYLEPACPPQERSYFHP